MKASAFSICLVLALALAPLAAAQSAPAIPPAGGRAPALNCQALGGGVLLFTPAPSAQYDHPDCDIVCAQALYQCTVVCPDYEVFRCAPVTCTAQCHCPE
jgi:hypothetical protein